ncbi:MAG: recombinase family protein [Fibromonadaceae bacterium]|jgi:DNA invertase Pin-like site-specific DNA recombinase|nr:recombinase family protein [Fibromonadaceae bacterium]
MIYGYIRVSTAHQNTENQRFELCKFAENQGFSIEKWITEKISSTKELKERKFSHLLKKARKGDIIIATEISRLGRNLLEIMDILHFCLKRGCQIWTVKEDYKLGLDIQSKVLAVAFGLVAEFERSLISARTKEALARVKAGGKKIRASQHSKEDSRTKSGNRKTAKIRHEREKDFKKNRSQQCKLV